MAADGQMNEFAQYSAAQTAVTMSPGLPPTPTSKGTSIEVRGTRISQVSTD